MNAAQFTKSDRLRRVAAVLADGREHSTREIIEVAHVCAVSAIAAELRANNMPIQCRRAGGVWWYRKGEA